MKKHWLTIGVTLVVAVTILSGVIQGRMRSRWGTSAAMKAAAAKLQDIPAQVGPWRLKASHELSESSIAMLECKGYINRTYVHEQSGATVTMFVIVGPAGPVAVHTPEVCMAGTFKQLEDRKHVSVDSAESEGASGEFWAVHFRSKDLRETPVRVYYAWSTGGPWSAPKDARYKFAGQPYLYKIQLQSSVPAGTKHAKGDPCWDFLQAFLPAAGPFLIETSTE